MIVEIHHTRKLLSTAVLADEEIKDGFEYFGRYTSSTFELVRGVEVVRGFRVVVGFRV
jgi:hypothetical protein